MKCNIFTRDPRSWGPKFCLLGKTHHRVFLLALPGCCVAHQVTQPHHQHPILAQGPKVARGNWTEDLPCLTRKWSCISHGLHLCSRAPVLCVPPQPLPPSFSRRGWLLVFPFLSISLPFSHGSEVPWWCWHRPKPRASSLEAVSIVLTSTDPKARQFRFKFCDLG